MGGGRRYIPIFLYIYVSYLALLSMYMLLLCSITLYLHSSCFISLTIYYRMSAHNTVGGGTASSWEEHILSLHIYLLLLIYTCSLSVTLLIPLCSYLPLTLWRQASCSPALIALLSPCLLWVSLSCLSFSYASHSLFSGGVGSETACLSAWEVGGTLYASLSLLRQEGHCSSNSYRKGGSGMCRLFSWVYIICHSSSHLLRKSI